MSTTTAAPPTVAPIDERSRPRRRLSATPLKYIVLLGFAVIVLTPVYVLLVTSVKGFAEIDPSHAWSLPQVFTIDAWHQAWTQLSPISGVKVKLASPEQPRPVSRLTDRDRFHSTRCCVQAE